MTEVSRSPEERIVAAEERIAAAVVRALRSAVAGVDALHQNKGGAPLSAEHNAAKLEELASGLEGTVSRIEEVTSAIAVGAYVVPAFDLGRVARAGN